MPEYMFLNRFAPYKDRIEDFVFIRDNMGQRKTVFWHILRNVKHLNEFVVVMNVFPRYIGNTPE